MHSVPGAVALACTSSSGIGPALPGCCRPRGSGPPGAEHVQPRQRASAGQVLARLADVAGWVLQAAGGGAARRRARPAAAAGRGRPDRRPQVSTRKKATGPDRAAGRRRPGARPARGRGRQAAGVGVARCRARPAAAAGQRWPGARPARGRGQQSKGSGPPGAGHVQQGQRASAGQVLADVASRSQGLGFGLSGVGHILQRQRPGLQGLVPVKNCPKLHEIHESGYRPRSIR